jgi:peptidoglycan-associated lipoprotein
MNGSGRGVMTLALVGLVAACGGSQPPAPAATPVAAAPAPATPPVQPQAQTGTGATATSQVDAVRAEVEGDAPAGRSGTVAAGLDAAALAVLQDRVHFDFDRADLREGDREKLRQKYDILRRNPNLRIEIEGHCDERGLRRATAAKQYLVALGIQSDRIAVRSYGNERPVDTRQNEEAWAMNRRAEFVVTQGAR